MRSYTRVPPMLHYDAMYTFYTIVTGTFCKQGHVLTIGYHWTLKSTNGDVYMNAAL